jgi:hypothetical protein
MFFTKPSNSSVIITPQEEPLTVEQGPAGFGDVFSTQEEAADKARKWYSFSENVNSVFAENRKRIKDLTGEDMPDFTGTKLGMRFQVTPEKEVNLLKDWEDYRGKGGALGFENYYRHTFETSYRERLQYLADKYPEHRGSILPSDQSLISQARQMGGEAERRAQDAWDRSKGVSPYLAWLGAEAKSTFKDPVQVGQGPVLRGLSSPSSSRGPSTRG